MCELCANDPEERERAVKAHRHVAEDLEQLASYYRSLASGTIRPHTDQVKVVGTYACHIIRVLVEDWV